MKRDSATPAGMPAFVEPMKANLVDSIPPGYWIYEIKFDDYRALALRGGRETRVLSRNEKDLGSKFPEVKDSIAALDVQDAIIDYAACGIMQRIFSSMQRIFSSIDIMPYADLRRTEHGVPPDEALSDAA